MLPFSARHINIKTFLGKYARPVMNAIRRYVMDLFAETRINQIRRDNPAKLREMGEYLGRLDYPYDDPCMNESFWRVYRKVVKDPARSC